MELMQLLQGFKFEIDYDRKAQGLCLEIIDFSRQYSLLVLRQLKEVTMDDL
jgi:hypothetical protein